MSGDPHGGMTCEENEAWADDMCGDINDVRLRLARFGLTPPPAPDDDLESWVINALHRAAATGDPYRLAIPVPEEWFA